jgi:2-polyprenyl-3-methyl-5-hydroxy-6-metoxy-1,4-benzoquinol methylase
MGELKALDRYLQRARIAKARPFIREGDVVVDVGCADGALLDRLGGQIDRGYGVDPTLEEVREAGRYTLYPGRFPEALPRGLECDAIVMLAVLEHVPLESQAALAAACHAMLRPGGRVIVTVPSPRVDDILAVLSRLRLIRGMSLEEHYGFEPDRTERVFAAPRFRTARRERFQLGLNNLFVFEKAGA